MASPVYFIDLRATTAENFLAKLARLLTEFVNFILNVSPACDCMAMNAAPIVGDIGVVASRDPVAIDQASVDLVNREPAAAGSTLDARLAKGEDKFKALYPQVDGSVQLAYAQQIGLGTRRYDLVRL
jgi:uncharacterized Fe-S center protein